MSNDERFFGKERVQVLYFAIETRTDILVFCDRRYNLVPKPHTFETSKVYSAIEVWFGSLGAIVR